MNKSRVEAFTDAVIAIILTIMILEFKTPESSKLSAITPQIPYMVSYAVGWLFIGIAWYNHHYMFSKAKVITRKIFWTNNFWMFTTSFIPVATAWVGRDLNAQGPEIFYAIVYFTWSLAYAILTHVIAKENERAGYEKVAGSIRDMKIYRALTSWKFVGAELIVWVLIIVFMPALQMLLIAFQVLFVGGRVNEDSDKMF
ncbi:TMEM175 family protein [Companilactobacillus huachuanensis]|uniref:TMEM175 family protein n=1 Tax=Companilactobacillus huachuanensis TaxID=2559914 RepID=A0ABW1RNJ6_9LACO|nr:TMEM175 family protein [Companilactobacillus huachuanensis]